jgi:DNA-binding response OmpR family regulator
VDLIQSSEEPTNVGNADLKVLIVEDDRKLARFLTRVLTEEGYMADTCSRGADATQRALSGIYAMVLLDWMLPDVDGLQVCNELRRLGCRVPIVMLTARGELQERVLGLESGADDYLVKPFEPEELLARIRAILRRTTASGMLERGPVKIDRLGRRVVVDERSVELTSREYALLLHFVQNSHRVVTKTELLTSVWNTRFDPGSNVVEVHVSRLREKLGVHASRIETVRGVGYRFHAEEPRH